MSVPLQDPAREYRALRDRIDEALLSVAASGSYVLGPEGEALEEELARYLGVDHVVGVGSGTDALVLSLRAVGVGPGDEVVVPPFTFFATAEAVLRAGAEPVFADIRPGTFCLDPEAAAEAVTGRTAALVPVHLFGQMADVDALGEVADRHDLALVEDAAQALGAAWRRPAAPGAEEPGADAGGPAVGGGDPAVDGIDEVGGASGPGRASEGSAATAGGDPKGSDSTSAGGAWTRAGAAGDVGCFSFYPTKNLAALGDAGAVVTDDAGTAERLRRLRDHGRVPGDGGRHAEPAWNTRMDELQAAVLRAKLEVLDEWNGRRRRHARAYDRAFDGLDGVDPPPVAPGNRHVYQQYTVRCEDREAVASALSEWDVGHGVYYPVPLHRQPALAGRHGADGASGRVGAEAPDGDDGGAGDADAAGGGRAGHGGPGDGGGARGGERSDRTGDGGAEGAPAGEAFPEAERAAREVLSLPVFPLLEDGERERVIEAVRDAVG